MVPRRAPSPRADRMHQRQSQNIAIKFDRFVQLPGWARGVIDPVQGQFDPIFRGVAHTGQITRAHPHRIVETGSRRGIVSGAKRVCHVVVLPL